MRGVGQVHGFVAGENGGLEDEQAVLHELAVARGGEIHVEVEASVSVVVGGFKFDDLCAGRALRDPAFDHSGVAGDADVISVDEGPDWVGHVFHLDVGDFRRAHLAFDEIAQSLLALGGRVVVVFLLLAGEMSRVFDSHIDRKRIALHRPDPSTFRIRVNCAGGRKAAQSDRNVRKRRRFLCYNSRFVTPLFA